MLETLQTFSQSAELTKKLRAIEDYAPIFGGD